MNGKRGRGRLDGKVVRFTDIARCVLVIRGGNVLPLQKKKVVIPRLYLHGGRERVIFFENCKQLHACKKLYTITIITINNF